MCVHVKLGIFSVCVCVSLPFCSACKVVINLVESWMCCRVAQDQYEVCLLNPIAVFVEKGNTPAGISDQMCF